MKLKNAVVLITGANRGIGLAFVEAALARGAARVYAAARNPAQVVTPGAQPLQLDVTAEEQVAAAVRTCKDVTLVVNNAGVGRMGGLLTADAVDMARLHMDTNVYGMLRMMQGFAPTLAGNGGGAFLNVLSVASWINSGIMGAYGISKAAAWSLTNGMRNELRRQNTQVLGLHMGFVDTDMARTIDLPKVSPQQIVAQAYDALEAGLSEVLADERAQQIKHGLTAATPVYL